MVAVRGAGAAPRGDGGLSEPREPLWASGLAQERRPADEDYFAPDAPPERAEPVAAPRGRRVGVLTALMVVLLVLLWGTILTGRSAYTHRDVLSAWRDIPMLCDTQRFDREDGAAELFTCRALGGAELPAGLYESPRAQWTSDLTREDARASVIRITRGGDLSGVAIY